MFATREVAGQKLANKLLTEDNPQELKKAVILGIPRGGVVVAWQVAKILKCPLDVIVTRKIRSPEQPELAVGAIGETQGSKYLNLRLVKDLSISKKYLEQEIKIQQAEIKRRESLYRQGSQPISLANKVVVLVDDGAATGATLVAAVREVWNANPNRVIVALPVAPLEAIQFLEKEADEVYVLETPEPFFAVGQFYKEFGQISDEEVIKILNSK